ncbi:MAG: hypothetical protein H7335_08185 [Massilia sp.]|nr:hypothetical protein [Massilia sp.]
MKNVFAALIATLFATAAFAQAPAAVKADAKEKAVVVKADAKVSKAKSHHKAAKADVAVTAAAQAPAAAK